MGLGSQAPKYGVWGPKSHLEGPEILQGNIHIIKTNRIAGAQLITSYLVKEHYHVTLRKRYDRYR
jgi:hypothetical protein